MKEVTTLYFKNIQKYYIKYENFIEIENIKIDNKNEEFYGTKLKVNHCSDFIKMNKYLPKHHFYSKCGINEIHFWKILPFINSNDFENKKKNKPKSKFFFYKKLKELILNNYQKCGINITINKDSKGEFIYFFGKDGYLRKFYYIQFNFSTKYYYDQKMLGQYKLPFNIEKINWNENMLIEFFSRPFRKKTIDYDPPIHKIKSYDKKFKKFEVEFINYKTERITISVPFYLLKENENYTNEIKKFYQKLKKNKNFIKN